MKVSLPTLIKLNSTFLPAIMNQPILPPSKKKKKKFFFCLYGKAEPSVSSVICEVCTVPHMLNTRVKTWLQVLFQRGNTITHF